jgi:hypothetical protein
MTQATAVQCSPHVRVKHTVCDIMPCSPVKAKQLFGGKCCLLCLTLLQWRWKRNVQPKRLLNFNGLHGLISQEHEHLVTTAVRTCSQVKVKVILRPTVSRSVRLGVRHPSGTRNQFFFLLEIFFSQLPVCYFVPPSLTRGRVCNLLFLLVLASAVPLGSESHGTQDLIWLSQFLKLPQPGGPGPRIYINLEQGGPDTPPGTGFPFRRLLDSQGFGGMQSYTQPAFYILSQLKCKGQSIWRLQQHDLAKKNVCSTFADLLLLGYEIYIYRY